MPDAGRTRYQQIANDLRSKLTAGTYTVGTCLPSITQLATEYTVSATVVQQALRELKRDRLVEGVRGKGVYVIAAPEPDRPDASGDQIAALEARLADVERRLADIEAAKT